jgi:uncharacterized membrane protein
MYVTLKNLLYSISPERIFLAFALSFGIAISVITPPFQTPDEFHHFYRAYQITEGHFMGIQKDNRLGGAIPVSIVNASKIFKPVRNGQQTDKETIVAFLNTPLKTDSSVFTDFPNTAIYSPVSYLPQALSIFVLKKLHFSIGYIFYGARFFTFLTWIIAIFYTIRILPVFKKLFVLLALLPMSLCTNSSLSADVITNIAAFLTIGYVLKCAFSDKKFTTLNFIVIALLLVTLACTKLLYVPLILLFLVIPKKKFSSNKAFYINFSLLALIVLAVTLYLATVMGHLHIPYSNYNPMYRDKGIDIYQGADLHGQLQFIMHQKLYFIQVLFSSLFIPDHFIRNCQGYIGVLGWFDLALFPWMYISAYVIILFTAVAETGYTAKSFIPGNKIVILISFLIMLFLIQLSQYLSYATVGDNYVVLQGRYFIPILPLFFMLLNRKGLKKQRLITLIISIYLLLLLSYTIIILYSRYY